MDGLLEKDGYQPPDVRHAQAPQVDPIYLDLAGIRVVQATEQFDKGAFAGPVGTHDRHDLPRWDREAEVAQGHPLAAGIAEGDVTEADSLFQLGRGWQGMVGVGHPGFQRQELEQMGQKKAVGVDLADVPEQGAHQVLALAERLVKKRQPPQRHLSLQAPARPSRPWPPR
jgi:hypothetical protein